MPITEVVMAREGGCMCGAVRFEVTKEITETGACHCGMCRKFSGGVYLAIEAGPEDLTFTNKDGLAVYKSSDWAERGFCKKCGSSLFYRLTAPGPAQGTYHFAMGSLDDTDGIKMMGEIYIDKKPEGYAFAGDLKQMTEAQFLKMFGVSEVPADA